MTGLQSMLVVGFVEIKPAREFTAHLSTTGSIATQMLVSNVSTVALHKIESNLNLGFWKFPILTGH